MAHHQRTAIDADDQAGDQRHAGTGAATSAIKSGTIR